MSYEEHKGDSPRVQDKGLKHRKEHKDKDKETLISGQQEPKGEKEFGKKDKKKKSKPSKTTESPKPGYAERDYMKSSGVGEEEGERKPFIEVIEETPSFTGGISGMSGPTAPPLISSASLRRFSTSQPSRGAEPLQENRLASAARELKDAAWQRAMEVKDTTLEYAGRLQQKYNLPLGNWVPAVGAGQSTWQVYGRKKKESMNLFEQAEQKLREARAAPPERAPDLFLEANILKQKALKKSIKAQQLAEKMKCKVDCQVDQLRKTTTPEDREKKMTAWELFGHTKQKANRLRAQAEVMEQEARQTQDRTRAGELLEEATRLRKKALNTAEEAQAYADGIKRAADDKVVELRKWAMRNEISGSGGGSTNSQPQQPQRPQSVDTRYQPPTGSTKY